MKAKVGEAVEAYGMEAAVAMAEAVEQAGVWRVVAKLRTKRSTYVCKTNSRKFYLYPI